ncbi:unnamed protein product [Ectocarpus sp. CCAP 1310/34]|nr:unnamed protein product [Ectocarpus sp. CCAP 1310/34]
MHDIPIADIGFDLTPLVGKGYSVGVLRQAEMAWWFLFDCLRKTPSKPWLGMLDPPARHFECWITFFL